MVSFKVYGNAVNQGGTADMFIRPRQRGFLFGAFYFSEELS